MQASCDSPACAVHAAVLRAGADLGLFFCTGRILGFQLARERLVGSVSRAAASTLIDRGVSEVAIEPRNDGFVWWRLLRSRDDLRNGILEDVFCKCAVTDPTFHILQKGSVVLKREHRSRASDRPRNVVRADLPEDRVRKVRVKQMHRGIFLTGL
jgi:hypothetical protein